MTTLLFLDDERNYDYVYRSWIHDCVTVRNYSQFIEYIEKNGLPELISFDHDLGEEKSGLDCLNWLIDYCLDKSLKLPDCYSHSMNVVGRMNILNKARSFNNFNA